MAFTRIKELFDITGDFGFPEEEIRRAEDRLSITFPKLLRTYYQELGNHKALNQTQDRLLDLRSLKVEDNEFLIFYVENQCVATWGISKHDMEKENPAVYRKEGGNDWQLDSKNLSSFFTSMALMQSIFAFDFQANSFGVENKFHIIVREHYKELKEDFALWNVKFYQNKNTELIAVFGYENQTDIYVAAKNKQDFESITSKLTLQWDYHSYRDQ